MPKVSVIIPIFNGEKFISEAIESVFNQTFKDYEIIVVNDGSTDNTNEIIKKYDSKLRYFQHENNKGPNAARNTGIMNSSGPYIAFLDSDDVWLENKLERQMELMSATTDLGLVGCGFYKIDGSRNIISKVEGIQYKSKKLLLEELMIRNVPCGGASGVVILRKCFENIGLFDESLKGSEDRDMWLRIARHYNVEFLKDPLVKIRVHKDNSSKNTHMMKCNQKKFIKLNLRNASWLLKQKAYSYIYLDAAREYYLANKHFFSFLNACTAISKYPLLIFSDDDKYQVLLKSFLPNSLISVIKELYNKKPKIIKKIKIIHIMQSLEIGGLENGVMNLVNNADYEHFEYLICCLKKEGCLKERLRKEVKVVSLFTKEGFDCFQSLKLARLFTKEKPHVIHTHGWGGGFLSGVVGAKIAGVPVVIHGEHGTLYIDKKRRAIAQKLLFNFTDKVITVSNDLKYQLIKNLRIKPSKIVPIINGVDTKKFKPDFNTAVSKKIELKLEKECFIVGTVGRLVSIKDYETLIYAAKTVLSKIPNTKFVFVGDGPLRKQLENLSSSLGLNNHIMFLGERGDTAALLNAMDLFVLTSLSEGLSNTILEAMAVARPIIATKVGGNPEIVKDGITGILIAPRNPKELADSIINLSANRELCRNLGDSGRNLINEKFSLQRMVQEYGDLYKCCLKKRNLFLEED